jgi:hypothetical protein
VSEKLIKGKKSMSRAHSSSNVMGLEAAVTEALSVLGPQTQEATLYVLRNRYNIDLEDARNVDKVYAAIDEIFGIAGRAFKKKINTNLRLVFPTAMA